MNLERNLNIVFKTITKCFNSDLISLNFDKTYMQFITKNKFLNKINIEHENKMVIQTSFIKFWGVTVDNTLSWERHIAAIIPKLNKACYIIRRSSLYLSQIALKMVYYAFFHSVMSYGLIFWGKSTDSVYSNYRK